MLWLGFLATWRTSGVAEQQLAVLLGAARPPSPALQLELSGPAGAVAAYQYEIGLSVADQRPSSFVIAGPAAAQPGSAVIHGANGMRTITNDYITHPKVRRVLVWAIGLAAAFLILLGTLVVFTFDPCIGIENSTTDFLIELCAAQ
ncbi:MAG TPA: hypothetical protein PLW65_32735 [Pseudomonadota bacterium]|nr:hypothetical protein [Pseudomonadota bacterium]